MNRIKILRLVNNKTQKDLAKYLNVSEQAIAYYEQGKREPKLETWQALADYFNVSVPYLQGEIFKEDLDDEAQEMFEDVQDYISYVVPIRKISSNWDCVERVNAHLVVED